MKVRYDPKTDTLTRALRSTRAKRFVSFIALILMAGIALGV